LSKAIPSLSSQSISKSLNKLNKSSKREEREWLLLGEPSSPTVRVQNCDEDENEINAESSILSDSATSDIDCIVKPSNVPSHTDNESSEDEEDIDSIVEEFQQKLQISTAGLKDTSLKIPTMNSWRCSMMCIMLIIGACIASCWSASNESTIFIFLSLAGDYFSFSQ
jgi:hypothetical protein